MRGDSDYPREARALHGPPGLSSSAPGPTSPKRARRSGLFFILLLAVLAPAQAAAGLRGDLDRALRSPYVSPSLTGAVAINLANGDAVYKRNAGLSLRPASNQKLTVALAALDRLGPEFKLETAVLGEGKLVSGVWQGRLVLKGYGDPTLTRYGLTRLAAKVRAAGITRVTEQVVGDESYYDKKRTVAGWRASYYKEECPPLSALISNRGKVNGRTVDDPARAAARAFRHALVDAGVRVPAGVTKGVAAGGAAVLGIRRSGPLSRIVLRMNKPSDNFYAEMLLKQLGARLRGVGSSAEGSVVVRRELRQRGVPLDGVKIVDGSGLSSYDRLTARALAALLISAWSDAAISDAFVSSLPVAGVDGTLEDRMTRWPAYGNVYAKTGTTATASSLSGYVRTRYVFSILQNGFPIAWYYARKTQDRFAQVLAGA